MEHKKQTVFIDLDGVLADFRKGIGRPNYEEDPPEMFLPNFYRNLPLMPYAKEYLPKLLENPLINVYIASKITTKTLYCATDKLFWVQEHFPMLLKKTHLTCDKGHLLGDYLIDDDIKRWEKKFTGTFIHFDEFNPKGSWEYILNLFA